MSYTARQFSGQKGIRDHGPVTKEELYEVISFLENELTQISRAFQEYTEVELRTVKKEPKRPADGMIVSADGVSWNPGSGKGIYAYLAGQWVLLGGTGLATNSSGNPFYVVDLKTQELLKEILVEEKVQTLILQTKLNFSLETDAVRAMFAKTTM